MPESRGKLLFIINDKGAFNNFLSELGYHLVNKKNIDVVVICSPEKVIDIEDKFHYLSSGIRFVYVNIPRGWSLPQYFSAATKIRTTIRLEKPDLVLAHFTSSIFATVLMSSYEGHRIWGTFHGLGFVAQKGLKRFLIRTVELYCISRLDKTIILSQKDFLSIPHRLRPRAKLISSLGLGCDLDKFNPKKFNHAEIVKFRQQYEISDQFVMAFLGRFVNFKGFNIVIEVFSQLSVERPGRYKLLLIGDEDRLHGMGLSRKASDTYSNHPDIIRTGFTSDVEKYLILADILFFPSKKEGVPIAVTESLAMGIPVLAFNSRGCSDLINNGHNGVLLDENTDFTGAVMGFKKEIVNLAYDKEYLSILKNNTSLRRDKLSRSHFIDEQTEWYLTEINKKKTANSNLQN